MENGRVRIIEIAERDINSGRMMEKFPDTVLASDMLISVPVNYYADVRVADGAPVTVKSCQKKKLVKMVGGDKVGKKVSVLFVNKRKLTTMSWGIGSLPIRYDFLGGAIINVGANGNVLPEIVDAGELYTAMQSENETVDITEVISIITAAFRSCASKILVEMFNEAIEPIFQTDFLVSELHRRLNERICNRKLKILPGVIFKWATVAGIRVREEDKNALLARYSGKNQSSGRR